MDPETLAILSAVYRKAEAALPPYLGGEEKMALAASILEWAEGGERDHDRLLAAALSCASIIAKLPPAGIVAPKRQDF